MPAKHLEASVRQEPGVAVIYLSGEINGFAQEALDAAYAEAEAESPQTILLNFEGVDYINSTGIALIDRKSTRLNSSHANISYAVFCLKKKKTKNQLSTYVKLNTKYSKITLITVTNVSTIFTTVKYILPFDITDLLSTVVDISKYECDT